MAIVGKLDYYYVFCTVARNGSISRAAQELYIAQPAVTRAIQALESQLDCRLLVRTAKGVQPTAEGQALYRRVSEAFGAIGDAEQELESIRLLENAVLRVSVNSLASDFLLKKASAVLKKRYPGLTIICRICNPLSLLNALSEGYTDMCVIFDQRYQAELLDENLPQYINSGKIRQIHLKTQIDRFMLGSKLYKTVSDPATLEELTALPLILPISTNPPVLYYRSILRPGGPRADDFLVNGMAGRLSLTVNNFGLSYFPTDFVLAELSDKKLNLVYSNIEMQQHSAYVLVNGQAAPSTSVTKMIEALRIQLGQVGGDN